MKHTIIITGEVQRRTAADYLAAVPLTPLHEISIKEHKTTRNSLQNAKLWATLADIAAQVIWHGQKLSKESWKDILTAAQKQQTVVPGIESGFVVLGAHTSKMSVAELAELIELAIAFGTHQGVKWKYYQEGE